MRVRYVNISITEDLAKKIDEFMKSKLKDEKAKISSTLMKDIARIRKTCEKQTKMNILRKHQIKLLN